MMNRNPLTGRRRVAIAAALVVAALFSSTLLALAGSQAGHWGAKELQVQNLASFGVLVTETLVNPQGTPVWIFTQIVPPKNSVYVAPPVPAGLTGTLRLDGSGPILGGVAHLEGSGEIGNEVYETLDIQQAQPSALMPRVERDLRPGGVNSVLTVHNLSAASGAQVALIYMGDNGIFTATPPLTIPPFGSVQVSVQQASELPPVWIGGARLNSTQPVAVEVAQTTGTTYDSYIALPVGDPALVGLLQPGSETGVVSTLDLINPNAGAATVQIVFSGQPPAFVTLPPNGHARVPAPSQPGAMLAYVVSANLPVAAVSHAVFAAGSARGAGAFSVPAFGRQRLSTSIAIPVLFDNYNGWTHQSPGAVRILNAGTLTATTVVYYHAIGQPGSQIVTYTLGALQFVDSAPPAAVAPHWVAEVFSTQPVAAAVLGFKQTTSTDRWLAFRGRPFTPMPVSPTPTGTVSPTPTRTPVASPTPTRTPVASPTPTRTPVASPTPTGTLPATPTGTVSPTPTRTPVASPTPTGTLPATPTGTVSPTPTRTPVASPTPTGTLPATPTGTVSPTPTRTATSTATPTAVVLIPRVYIPFIGYNVVGY